MQLLLVPGTVAPGLSGLRGHRYTAAGMHASSPLWGSSSNLTPVLEAFSFVTGAGFKLLSRQMKTLLSTHVVSFPS